MLTPFVPFSTRGDHQSSPYLHVMVYELDMQVTGARQVWTRGRICTIHEHKSNDNHELLSLNSLQLHPNLSLNKRPITGFCSHSVIIIIIIIMRTLSAPSQLSPRHVKQSSKKMRCSRHQKLTHSTHKCLNSIILPPPSHTHTHTRTQTSTHIFPKFTQSRLDTA